MITQGITIILWDRKLIIMLKDRQDIESVYKYLDTTHSTESEELRNALKMVFSEPAKEIAIETPPEPIVDMTGIDLSLQPLSKQDIPELNEIIKSCYSSEEGAEKLYNWDLNGFDLPGCRWFYKVAQGGKNVGAVNLICVGMEAMLIRSITYNDPDNNVYLLELLKQAHPDILCRNIYFPNKDANEGEFHFDWEGKKKH